MILTPIAPEALPRTLDRFMAGLREPLAHTVFNGSAPPRPIGLPGRKPSGIASRNLLRAQLWHDGLPRGNPVPLQLGRSGAQCHDRGLCHPARGCHFALASPERRGLIEFGLGPGPDTLDRDAAERAAILPPLEREQDEAAASLLGIIWEARLAQPALASFLDQNWLEGLDRSAPAHFTAVLKSLRDRGLLSSDPMLAASTAPKVG
jgi:hypothetical protein